MYINVQDLNIDTGNRSVNSIYFGDTKIADSNTNTNWTKYNQNQQIEISSGSEIVQIIRNPDNQWDGQYKYNIRIITNYASSTIYTQSNCWLYIKSLVGTSVFPDVWFYNGDGKIIFSGRDLVTDTKELTVSLSSNLINFDGISWMTW